MYDTVEKVFARAPELLELGLSVPQVTQVFLMLKAMGMEIDTDVYTVPYAVKTVLKAWNAKHPDKAVPLSGGGVPAGKKVALRVLPPRGQRALRDMPAAP